MRQPTNIDRRLDHRQPLGAERVKLYLPDRADDDVFRKNAAGGHRQIAFGNTVLFGERCQRRLSVIAQRGSAGKDTAVAALFVASAKTAYPAFAQENVAVAGTDITISVDAPEGAFPEGVQMRVSLKETPEAVLEAANAELAKEAAQETKTEESVEAARAKVTEKDAVTFNIEFYLPDDPETEIEPLVPISVTFGNIALDGDTLEVYHSDDSQEGEVQVEKVLDVS